MIDTDHARLTCLVLKSIDKRLSSTERKLWHKQAYFTARRIEKKELQETIRRIQMTAASYMNVK